MAQMLSNKEIAYKTTVKTTTFYFLELTKNYLLMLPTSSVFNNNKINWIQKFHKWIKYVPDLFFIITLHFTLMVILQVIPRTCVKF